MIKSRTKLAKKFYRFNLNIQAREVRVIDEKGKQTGVMSLSDALKQAQEKGLDLVEVAPQAQPPVCKIIDFKKFKYLESKKEQEEKKKSKSINLKEIRLTPFMAEADFSFRIHRAEKFLKSGDRVKLAVFFKGRAITKKEFGYEILRKAVERLSSLSKADADPKFIGRRLEVTLSPAKGGKNGKKEKDENKEISR